MNSFCDFRYGSRTWKKWLPVQPKTKGPRARSGIDWLPGSWPLTVRLECRGYHLGINVMLTWCSIYIPIAYICMSHSYHFAIVPQGNKTGSDKSMVLL